MIIYQGGRKMGPARRYGLHVAGQIWYEAWRVRNRQLTRHAYPGQPATRTRPPTKPCTCWYETKDIRTSRGMYQPLRLVHGTGFTIEPTCPHHGDVARSVPIEALWNDPWLNVARDPYDLDDNERTNQ